MSSLYRRIIWYLKGLREYTKEGFERAASGFDDKNDNFNLSGKSFLITGSNSGLGKSVAKSIAQKGGTVHMVCRNVETAQAAKEEIISESQNEDVHVHKLDLSQPRDVVKFANDFCSDYGCLDVLINNAGCLINERLLTDDFLETNFATNTLGTHLLTYELLPALRRAPGGVGRVVTVSSGGMLLQKLNPKDLNFLKLQPFDGAMAYAQNKRQQVVLMEQFGKRMGSQEEDGWVRFWSCHPGWADTPSVASSLPDFYRRHKDRLRTVEQGADTILWLAVSQSALKHEDGAFFQDREPVGQHLPLACTRCTDEEEDIFWNAMEALRLLTFPD